MTRPSNEQLRRQRISRAVSKFKPETIQKLEQAFALDATVEEACFYANISPSTYYHWISQNRDLLERFEAIRTQPILKARQTMVQNLDNPVYAFRYLERKRPYEFGVRQKVEITSRDAHSDPSPSPEVQALVDEFEEKLRQKLVWGRKQKA